MVPRSVIFLLAVLLTSCRNQEVLGVMEDSIFMNRIDAKEADQLTNPNHTKIKSSRILKQVEFKRYEVAEMGENYIITQPVIKHYGKTQMLVKSSQNPIDLGSEMLPYMDLADLRAFMEQYKIERSSDSPEEIYLYNWVDGAQGSMIFQTGCIVEDVPQKALAESTFSLIHLAPLKVASILYIGPFPYQEKSGWSRINWEKRAVAAGFEYSEVLYRELYHRYDFDGANQHVTEIEISIR